MIDVYLTIKKIFPRQFRLFFKPFYLKWKLRNFNKPQIIKIKNYNFSIWLDPANRAVDEYIFIHRNWETRIGAVIEKHLSEGAVFVDAGANIGYFSLQAASVVGSTGAVVAFEPIARVAQQITKSASVNQFNNITVRPVALGSQPGTLTLSLMSGNIGGSSLVKDIPGSKKEIVEVTTLDIELSNQTRVDVIKIDVEGYELEVLQGAKRVLDIHRPVLVMEFSPSVYEKRDSGNAKSILELLQSYEYTISDIERGVVVDNIDVYLKELGREQTNLLAVANERV